MRISTNIDTNTNSFRRNYDAQTKNINLLNSKLANCNYGGGKELIARQHDKGKLTAKERINALIDHNSQFFELSALAGDNLYNDHVPAGGIITGVARICSRLCMVIANDQTVKGGTYYPITIKKHLRAQEIAAQNHLPCVYLVDSGGAFLPKQDEVFPDREHFGRIFYNQARMSANGIAQIAAVHGHCTAGGAYIPAMSDQAIIVRDTGTIFLAGPPLVEAATGEKVSAQELGGGQVHTAISGVADHLADNDEHALKLVRDIINTLRPAYKQPLTLRTPQEPYYDSDELLGIIPYELSKSFDAREIIARIVDGSQFFEFKRDYGTTLVTGYAHITGIPVGIIANNGILFSDSALKGTHFVELCCQEQRPIIFLQNVTGFMVGKQYEHEGIAKHGAKLVHAVSNANVPKITVITGASYGAGNYGMCGRAFNPSYLFMWPNAKIAVMGAQQAAQVLVTVKQQQCQRNGTNLTEQQKDQISSPVIAKYENESSAFYSSARLWDDGVISPTNTRQILSMALSSTICYQWKRTHQGVYRF